MLYFFFAYVYRLLGTPVVYKFAEPRGGGRILSFSQYSNNALKCSSQVLYTNDKWYMSCFIYYLIYLTLHWPFLINLRLCSLSINSYEYRCHNIWAGLFNALFIWLIYGKVAQWLKFRALNHDIMGSNPAETVYFLLFFCFHDSYEIIFCRYFCTFSMFLLI